MLGLVLAITIPTWGRGGPDNTGILLFITALTVLPLLVFQVYQWHRTATTGQSLGKSWLAMRVVREDGTPPGFLHGVVLRSWVPLALFVVYSQLYINLFIYGPGFLYPLYFILADCATIFGVNRRCVHDYIAGTRVVSTRVPASTSA